MFPFVEAGLVAFRAFRTGKPLGGGPPGFLDSRRASSYSSPKRDKRCLHERAFTGTPDWDQSLDVYAWAQIGFLCLPDFSMPGGRTHVENTQVLVKCKTKDVRGKYYMKRFNV